MSSGWRQAVILVPKVEAPASFELKVRRPGLDALAEIITANKNDREIAFDPFSIESELFALELDDFQIVPGSAARGSTADLVTKTIIDLGLNRRECCKAREA